VLPKYRDVPKKHFESFVGNFVGNKTNFDKVSDKDPEERVLGQARDFPLVLRVFEQHALRERKKVETRLAVQLNRQAGI
jgi:hypothetical protein